MVVGDSTGGEAVLKGRRILVVDDEADTRTLITSILEDNGASTIQAADGDEAIELARRERPDLVTLDLSMPGVSGVDVFVALREDPDLADIPICIVTGRPEMRRLIYERPAHSPPEGYLDKPFTEKALVRNVRKIFEVSGHKKG